jgi:1-pyrroline-5-carboxylate dehydrogenase
MVTNCKEAHKILFIGFVPYFQSDLESASEVEDSHGHQLDRISKEQLYAAYRKVQAHYTKYKGRYVDLARHYRELDRDNVKAKVQDLNS